MTANPYYDAALRLHTFLEQGFLQQGKLVGPDPGVRWNYYVLRFIKGRLPMISWNDDLYYLQGQGYWVMINWRLYDFTGDERFAQLARACADAMIVEQRDDGAWDYPNPEWKGRVATVEGVWACFGLIDTFEHTQEEKYKAAVLRWHRFLVDEIGFIEQGDELAINYFAKRGTTRVPNNSVLALRYFGRVAPLNDDSSIAPSITGMFNFVSRAQEESGRMPYTVPREDGTGGRPTFQDYQYNSFQALDLMDYWQATGDERAVPIITGMVNFLKTGVAEDGHAYYDVDRPPKEITYHTAVLACALSEAARLGLDEAATPFADKAYAYLLVRQRKNGAFIHSRRDYGVLSDTRAYPRYLAMILLHLLHRVDEAPQ